MLTCHSLLDNLDEDLLAELDQVVRENQLARCPFARSGRADVLLHDRHPTLAEDIDEERQARVKEMAYKASQKDEEKKLSSSFKTRFGSLDESVIGSPTPDRANAKAKAAQNEPFTPVLRAKDSQAELIFDMDEEEVAVGSLGSPTVLRSKGTSDTEFLALSDAKRDSKGKAIDLSGVSTASYSSPPSRTPASSTFMTGPDARKVPGSGNPWGSSNLSTPRLDLREVLAESKPAQSALSAGLAAEKKNATGRLAPQKMSQKEKKKYLQQQAEQAAKQGSKAPEQPWAKVGEKKKAPWQPTTSDPAIPAKDMLSPGTEPRGPSPIAKPLVAAETSSAGKSIPRRTASPDTRFAGQKPTTKPVDPTKAARPDPHSQAQPLVPHSKSYIKRAPKPEAEVALALADIIGQQQREQQSVKEAVAKRSLQEIQQEQEFQEWWDQESKRMQEEEAARIAREKGRGGKKEGGAAAAGRRGRGNKSKGGNNRGGGAAPAAAAESSSANAPTGGRGRGRGSRGGKAPQ